MPGNVFQYIVKRVLEAIPVLLIIITLAFFMVKIAPGGPFDDERALLPEVEKSLNEFYGLDKPLYAQYWQYLSNLAHGDLGPSFKYPGWSVNEIIRTKLPISLELGLYALLFAFIVGVTIGVIAAQKPNSGRDYVLTGCSMAGICLPGFVIGPLLILLFGVHLEWVNASGWKYANDRILPALTLGIYYAAYLSRLARGSMVEVMNKNYIRTARAKGLSRQRIIGVHGLRNALSPILSYMGPALAGLISGSFVVETIFHIPGLGRFFVIAAFNRDYTLVLGTVLVFAVLIIVFNLLTDVLLVVVNPRQKLS